MIHEEKIKYMKIAAGIVGYGFKHEQLDMLVSLYELVLQKQGDTDVREVCKVQEEVENRAAISSKIELLDKVSTVKK